jgi:hypothetical protein
MAGRGRAVTGGQPSRRGKRIPLLSIRTSMRLAAASAWVGPTITPKPAYVGRVRADGPLTCFWRSQEIVTPQAFSPTSEQLAARTAEKVPTLEGLLHQIEVRIDPAFAQISSGRPLRSIEKVR